MICPYSDWNLECRGALLQNVATGAKSWKKPGKIQFPMCCSARWVFNESFVAKMCENLQGDMRFSATHRMPPAKKYSSQHVNRFNPRFSKYWVYAELYVLCAAHIECCTNRYVIILLHNLRFCSWMPPKTYKHVIILLHNFCFWKNMVQRIG